MPKICVPITDKTAAGIISSAKESLDWDCEIVEWRVDTYENFRNLEKTREVLEKISALYKSSEKLFLFTCRTASDGGVEIDRSEYFKLNEMALGKCDLIDIEMNSGAAEAASFIESAHQKGTSVVVSYHDFDKTPSEKELISRMQAAEACSADVVKVAVMPQKAEDVDVLMKATSKMRDEYAHKPLITMSMGALGRKSRIEGQLFGSAVTFGAVKAASAPGQIELSELRSLLKDVDAKINK